jgi:hypothetical protein
MSDAEQPYLHPVTDGKWLVRVGRGTETHEPLGEVTEREDGAFLAHRGDGSERVVQTQEQALAYVVQCFAVL